MARRKLDAPLSPAGPGEYGADLAKRCGGVMRIGRAIVIPAILALSVAGAALTGSEASVAAAQASGTAVHTTAISSTPNVLYHG